MSTFTTGAWITSKPRRLRVRDIDHEFAQGLVDRFIAAGAITIYIGPHTGLHGPAPIVRIAKNHDNQLHVRYAKPARVSATMAGSIGPEPCQCPPPPDESSLDTGTLPTVALRQ